MALSPLPIAVLISGSGRTLRNLIERIAQGRLDVEIRLVVSSHASAGGLRYAEEAGIPTKTVRRGSCVDAEAFRDEIFGACREARVRLVVMAGFVKHLPIPADFLLRVINIHPALIPAFCGQGYYGHRVHEAVLEYGVKVTGCTIHFVDDQYDHGPIILQQVVPVRDDDTPQTLADRVFAAECEAYPKVLQLSARGQIRVAGRKVTCVARPE